MNEPPRISVLMPCRNEARHIAAVLDTILAQAAPPGGIEVIVADGRSTDDTRAQVQAVAQRDQRVRLIDNPGGFAAHGVNAAVAAARGEILVRMDAHTTYAPDYICACVATLERTGADNVGGPWVAARGTSYLSRAIAAAFQAPFAVGGARGHREAYEGVVDTVYLGCWSKATFEKFGRFDEEFLRNEDDEYNLRITRRGGKVWQSPRIRSWYTPRSSLVTLFRQYCQYGYWKVPVIRKHRRPASIRHVVPGLFVLALAGGSLFAPFSGFARLLTAAVASLYGLSVLAATVVTGWRSDWRLIPALPAVFLAYHFGYGCGFLIGVLDFVLLRRAARAAHSRLTR